MERKTIRCPFMPEHIMHVDSLLTHLNRCQATNKHLFASCPYNCLHIVPKEQIVQHIRECQDLRAKKKPEDEEQWESTDYSPNTYSYPLTSESWESNENEEQNYNEVCMKKDEPIKIKDNDVDSEEEVIELLDELELTSIIKTQNYEDDDQFGNNLANSHFHDERFISSFNQSSICKYSVIENLQQSSNRNK